MSNENGVQNDDQKTDAEALAWAEKNGITFTWLLAESPPADLPAECTWMACSAQRKHVYIASSEPMAAPSARSALSVFARHEEAKLARQVQAQFDREEVLREWAKDVDLEPLVAQLLQGVRKYRTGLDDKTTGDLMSKFLQLTVRERFRAALAYEGSAEQAELREVLDNMQED